MNGINLLSCYISIKQFNVYFKYPSDVLPNHLQKMDVLTYDNAECQKFHDDGPKSNKIYPGMLCGFNKLNIGACRVNKFFLITVFLKNKFVKRTKRLIRIYLDIFLSAHARV